MVMSNITLRALTPDIDMMGDYIRFIGNDVDPEIKFQMFSTYVPIPLAESLINIETRNHLLSGFRLKQTTTSADISFGSFMFQSYVADDAGDDLFGFSSGLITFYKTVNFAESIYVSSRIVGRRESAIVYWDNNATSTPIGSANVFTKLLGTTTLLSDSLAGAMPANNRLAYSTGTGAASIFKARANVSLKFAGAATALLSISIYKNGVQLPIISSVTSTAANNVYNLTIETFVSLLNNDYIELWASSSATDATGITSINGYIIFDAA